jgi:hypothetical protein
MEMPNESASEGRVVLERSRETRVIRGIGAAVTGILLCVLLWTCFSAWLAGALIESAMFLIFAGILVPVFLRMISKQFIKVMLLENHFSVVGWSGVPKIYSYEQITNLETVSPEEWKWTWEFETFVRVTLADGTSVKIHDGLIDSRKFRKFLRSKTGRIFRKPKSKTSWIKKISF